MLVFDREFEAREQLRQGVETSVAVAAREPSAYTLADLLEIFLRYAKLIIGIAVCGTLLSVVATYSLTKTYTASSTLVFDRNDTRPYESVLELQNLERDKSAMDTEMDMVESREFLGFVVDDLRLLEDPYFNPRPAAQSEGMSSWLPAWLSFGDADESARGRQDLRERIAASGAQRDRAITRLIGSVSAARRGDSLAMTISVQHALPARAAEIANGVASDYVVWTSRLKERAAKNTLSYLRVQAVTLADSIAKKEREMAEFTTRSDLTFDPRDDVVRARMEQLNEQFTLARVDEAGAWAKFNEAQQLLATSVDSVGRVLTSDLLSTLRTEEGRLLRTRAQLTAKFGRNHPLVMDADAEIASNRRLIDEEVRRIVQELENDAKVASVRVKKFQQEVGRLQKEMQDRNLNEIRRRELERDLLAEQKRYDEVVLRLGSFDPEQEEVKATARMASFAEVPSEPSFPQPELIIPVGAIASLLVAVMVAIASDALDKSVRTASAAEAIVKRPNLVSVPNVQSVLMPGESPYYHMLANPHAAFARAMRSLCLAWRALEPGAEPKVLMLTSASAGEGKTTCALGMAAMATTSGLRSVILDIDPKPDGAAGVLGIANRSLSLGMVAEGTVDLDAVIAVAPEYPFLRVISSRMGLHDHGRLFDELRRRFDLIIVDAPSFDRDDDAVWLCTHVDAVLVVVAAERTQEQDLKEAVERLGINRAPVAGILVNFSAVRREGWRRGVSNLLRSLKSTLGRKLGGVKAARLRAWRKS